MAILVRNRPQGLDASQYDQIAPPLIEMLKRQPGFVLHVAFEDSRGFCVAEIWESKEQHDSWFDAYVAPNVPVEIEQEFIQVHAIERP